LRIEEILKYIAHAERQMDQIRRRVVEGETIPHHEKVFSLFEEYTEWINKGKAGLDIRHKDQVLGLETSQHPHWLGLVEVASFTGAQKKCGPDHFFLPLICHPYLLANTRCKVPGRAVDGQ
jgi:hypothetical protein